MYLHIDESIEANNFHFLKVRLVESMCIPCFISMWTQLYNRVVFGGGGVTLVGLSVFAFAIMIPVIRLCLEYAIWFGTDELIRLIEINTMHASNVVLVNRIP